jgi:hypothetical protein
MVSSLILDHGRHWSVPLALGLVLIFGNTPTPAQTPAPGSTPAPASAQAAPQSAKTQSIDWMVRDVLASLARFDQDGRNPANKVSFELPEKAVNDYLIYALREHPRPGISSITVSLLPRNEVALSVEIDFDAVPKSELQAVPEPLRPLVTGKRTFKLNAGFDSSKGTIRFHVRDAKGPEGTAIPQKILSEVLRSIGSRQPESYDPEKPNPLPFGVQRVWTEKQLICGET